MPATKSRKSSMSKDQQQIKKYLTIAKGQLEGIIRMVEEDRYCMDISDQLMATRALLKKANNQIIKNHIDVCVRNAIENGDDSKVDEVIKALERQI